jgi:type IV pilus assembly protein PilE
MRSIFSQRALTLLELMVVVVILAVLAGLAFPRFSRTMEAAHGREARVGLELIYAAEQLVLVQVNTYQDCSDIASCNSALNLALRSNNWDYDVTVTALPSPTFLARATRVGGLVPFVGATITVDQTGAWAGSWPLSY